MANGPWWARVTSVAALVAAGLGVTLASGQSRPLPSCQPWQTCRQLALDAADRGEGELFHDLAWRTIQIGPQSDPDLLWLLARAQSMSGRPHDALVLVRRLAEMGVATSADTDEGFARTRELTGWPDVAALLARVRRRGTTGGVPPTPSPKERPGIAPTSTLRSTPAAAPVAPRPSSAATAAVLPVRVRDEPLSFSTTAFTPGGLAYDVVSRRFVVGDTAGRRVMVVGVDTKRAIDMVRADSARFQDVVDLGIDPKRGDLWVTSRSDTGEDALHRLQLVSGRPLRIYHPPALAGPVRLGDLAVAKSGRVVVVDTLGRRLLTPMETGLELRVIAQLVVTPSSVTTHADDDAAYVAHADGIVRVDLKTGTSRALSDPEGLTAGFERLRAYRDGLLGIRTDGNARRLVFLPLGRGGTSVGIPSVLDATLPSGGRPPFLSVLDDEVAYLVTPTPRDDAASGSPPAADEESIIHRLRVP